MKYQKIWPFYPGRYVFLGDRLEDAPNFLGVPVMFGSCGGIGREWG